jgi:hypothetical protein
LKKTVRDSPYNDVDKFDVVYGEVVETGVIGNDNKDNADSILVRDPSELRSRLHVLARAEYAPFKGQRS